MKTGKIVAIIIAAVIGLTAMWGIGTHNSMVTGFEDVKTKASNIETQLQRRSDLIPNLVETVKGYASHEEGVYSQIAEARAKLNGAIQNGDVEAQSEANSELDSALARLLVIVEQYPELKANEQFIALQDELAGTENRINKARQDYNEQASSYNKKIKTFPNSIIAGMGNFESVSYFEADEGAKDVPTVSFN